AGLAARVGGRPGHVLRRRPRARCRRAGAGDRHRLGRGAGPRRLRLLRPLHRRGPPAVPGAPAARARELLETATRGAVRFPRQVLEGFTGAGHLRNEYRAGRVPEAVWAAARDTYEVRLLPLLRRTRAGPNEALAQHLRN